ncbi:MAG: hypothetical protein ACTSUQ_01625 [Candidatus Freyarchaeota archaeon]
MHKPRCLYALTSLPTPLNPHPLHSEALTRNTHTQLESILKGTQHRPSQDALWSRTLGTNSTR